VFGALDEVEKERKAMSLDREVMELWQKVGKLERQVAFLLEHLGLEYREEPNAGVSPEVLDLVRRGKTVKAIQQFRRETGLGLKEAKEFIESLASNL
jgi:ribosomal protein L7/L12